MGEDIRNLKTLTPSPYWSVDNVVSSSLKKPFQGSAQEAIKELDTILRQTISGQLLADVDVGAFLSGGIDSSYLTLKAKDWNLRPLVVHVDAGWNSNISVSNIKRILL